MKIILLIEQITVQKLRSKYIINAELNKIRNNTSINSEEGEVSINHPDRFQSENVTT